MVILIDDDKLIHASWKVQAKSKNIQLRCFFSISDFLSHSDVIPVTARIYIDSELGTPIKGEIASRQLFELGYREIYLCTGYLDLDISSLPWISGIITKRPPF